MPWLKSCSQKSVNDMFCCYSPPLTFYNFHPQKRNRDKVVGPYDTEQVVVFHGNRVMCLWTGKRGRGVCMGHWCVAMYVLVSKRIPHEPSRQTSPFPHGGQMGPFNYIQVIFLANWRGLCPDRMPDFHCTMCWRGGQTRQPLHQTLF